MLTSDKMSNNNKTLVKPTLRAREIALWLPPPSHLYMALKTDVSSQAKFPKRKAPMYSILQYIAVYCTMFLDQLWHRTVLG